MILFFGMGANLEHFLLVNEVAVSLLTAAVMTLNGAGRPL